jgi:hypothetical protein
MTLGVTIFGTIQNKVFTKELEEAFKGMPGDQGTGMAPIGDSRSIFEASERIKIPPFVLDKIVDAMSASITLSFMFALIPIVL